MLELYPSRKSYPKVLKARQLEMFQFRTVSGSADGGSLGKEMGKLLGKPSQTDANGPECFWAISRHLMCMSSSLTCDEEPCRAPRGKGVSLP